MQPLIYMLLNGMPESEKSLIRSNFITFPAKEWGLIFYFQPMKLFTTNSVPLDVGMGFGPAPP